MNKHMLIVGIIIVICSAINIELPNLVKTSFKGNSLPSLNVTIGQKFSLPLPHFDSVWESKSFQVYQMQQEQFNKFSPIRSDQTNKSISTTNEKRIEIDYLPFECSLKSGKMYIKQQLKSLREQYSRSKNTVWQQNQYIHLSFRSLLYILKVGSSQIIAYLYNDVTIDKLTTYKINQFVQREENVGDLNKSPPVIALDSKEESMFLFTSLGIWQIKTKTILTDVKPINNLSGFNSKDYGGIDKILHGQQSVMVALKKMSKVIIIPQNLDPSQNSKFKQIVSFKGIKDFYPQDIYMTSNTLYVLDYKKGVYIYTILSKGQYSERTFIPFESFGGNFMFTVYQNTIFINFNDIDGSKIVEINYNIENQQHFLVRYIKGDDYICELFVFNALTQYQGKPLNQKYSQESFDSFLFVLLNFDDIEIYPFNLDPRIINQAYNAVKLKGNDIRKIFHLKLDRYILITNEQIKYVRIVIQKPAVVCQTKRLPNSSPSKYFRLAMTSNVSTCQHKDHNLPQKKVFYEYCQLQTSFLVHIGDPQETEFERIMLVGVVIGVITVFIGGLVCLMQWRKNKMMILSRLKDQILRFRNRHKKMQPFTEQNVEQRQIQIQMPVVHVTSEDNQ